MAAAPKKRPTTPARTLAQNLAAARQARGIQQIEIAKALGRSPALVNKWERGTARPNVNSVLSLCEVLDVSIETIVAGLRPVYDRQRAAASPYLEIAALLDRLSPEQRAEAVQVFVGMLRLQDQHRPGDPRPAVPRAGAQR